MTSNGEDPSSSPPPRRTIACLLCGGVHIFPGPRYENHLINEHGVIFQAKFIVQLTLYQETRGHLPDLEKKAEEEEKEEKPLPPTSICVKCQAPVDHSKEDSPTASASTKDPHLATNEENAAASVNQPDEEEIHQDESEPVLSSSVVKSPNGSEQHFEDEEEEELLVDTIPNDETETDNTLDSGLKRKPVGKEWAPLSFSSTFTCYFCHEQFRKDYKLKLHLMLSHSDELPEDLVTAKEELTKGKLDGCIHQCHLCGSTYNSGKFTRRTSIYNFILFKH